MPALIWLMIAATAVTDAVLLSSQGMSVAIRWQSVLGAAALCGFTILYRQRAPSLARMAMTGAQLIVFSNAIAILTYAVMAASPAPFADARLSQADAAIGFDWLAWFHFVADHPILHRTLNFAYISAAPQGLALIICFAITAPGRAEELLLSGMIAILLITPIMALLPAAAAWRQHGVGTVEPWLTDILALHAHQIRTITHLDGIVTFPSYHTVLAILFTDAARGRKWFPPMLLLNLLMIASVPSEGAHYLVDLLSGIAVAFMALAATQFLTARCAKQARPAREPIPAVTPA